MIDLGLSSSEKKALLRTLSSSHMVSVDVHLLDLEHRSLAKLSGRVTGGQVNIDVDADVTRQAQLTILDPKAQVSVDTDDGAPRLDRMIRIHYNVWVDAPINNWVGIPIFTGPITTVRREEGVITVEALGKELIALDPGWRSATYPKGRNKVDTLRAIMRDLTGERHFQMPTAWSARTEKTISLTKNAAGWTWAKNISKSLGAQVFYDGRGKLRLRRRPIRSVFTFRDGDGGTVLTPPLMSESERDLTNTVRVIGAVPKRKKKALTKESYLPKSHPYNPQKIGRYGKARHRPETIEDDNLRTQAEVDRVARRRIAELQVTERQVSFDCLPIPILEEYDPVTIDCKGAKGTVRITQMTIPLGHAGVSTIGYIGKVSKKRR